MASKVIYKHGTKETYLGLTSRLSNALYFCTDTKELFKGDDLYSDGLRVVNNYLSLPLFPLAADGILYFCEDTGCGYVLSASRDSWIQVLSGVDNDTIELNEDGLITVKSVDMNRVSGLSDALSLTEQNSKLYADSLYQATDNNVIELEKAISHKADANTVYTKEEVDALVTNLSPETEYVFSGGDI